MKISIIGAGNVGANVALMCLMKNIGDEVVIFDILQDIPQGKVLDFSQAGPIFGFTGEVKGTNNYEDIASSDIIIVTAGFPRKEGMTRLDLLQKNVQIVLEVVGNIKKYSHESIVILTTNPLDVMSYLFLKKSEFSKNKIIGMAGILDTCRFIYYLHKTLHVPKKDISTIVLGVHGENMVPLIEHTKINNRALIEILPLEEINKIILMTRQGGAEIIRQLKTSAYIAPAAAVVQMIETIVKDRKNVYPCSVYLNGEYGYKDIFLGVPVGLGRNGIEGIIEIPLSKDTKKKLDKSAEEVKEGIEELGRLGII